MTTVRFVYTLDYVAEMLEEDVDLLQAIIYNDDNLTYGNIISVVTGDDQSTSALTDDGIDELRQMLADARKSVQNGKNSSNALSMTKRSSPASRHIHHGNNRAVTIEYRTHRAIMGPGSQHIVKNGNLFRGR
ncbi:Uncharacterised protein [Brucella anthropi]|nr:Uncharacterised protein [Brucella anthropi]